MRAEGLGRDDREATRGHRGFQVGVGLRIRADEQGNHHRGRQAVAAVEPGQDRVEALAEPLQIPVVHRHARARRARRRDDPGGDVIADSAFRTGNRQHQGRCLGRHRELVLTPVTPGGAVTRGAYRKGFRGTVISTHRWG
jgi:hypothetical protein